MLPALQKKGWWNILANKKDRKYIVLIVVFTFLFFICMSICFVKYRALAHEYKTSTISYRMDCVELEESMFGPGDIFTTLYFDKDHEEAFDSYWEFADVYLAYVRGRFADDKTPYIDEIQTYIDSVSDSERKKTAEEYLDVLNHGME